MVVSINKEVKKMKLVWLLAIILSLGLTACDDGKQNQTQNRTAVVDLGRLMRDSVPGKEGIKFIESQQKEMQAQLDAIQDKLEKNPNDESLMQQLQNLYALSQQKIQAEGQNIASQILDVVQRTLNNYLEKNNYDVIIGTEALAAYNVKLDITNAVLAEVDKQKIEFKPVNIPQKDKQESKKDNTSGENKKN